MAKQTKLQRLLAGTEYADVQDILSQLEARMERIAPLNNAEGMEEATRFLLLTQEEAALAEMRWQLHNSIRRFIWELERL